MKRSSAFVSFGVLACAVMAAGVFAQEAGAPKPTEQKAPAASEKATVVFLGNSTCPGDSKPVDREKFVEVDGQRIYVCSDECAAALKKDPAAAKSALAKAYPTAQPVTAKVCTCGEALQAGKTTAVAFQGHKVELCCADCASEFKKAPVTSIALLMHPDVKDVKNTTDPINDKPIDPTIVAIYKTHLVHFATWADAATFEKDPATSMKKLKISD